MSQKLADAVRKHGAAHGAPYMAIIIAVLGGKGGGGKTLTTANLAAIGAVDQLHPLIIDMDQQASISSWVDVRTDQGLTNIEYEVGNTANLGKLIARNPGRLIIIDTPPHHSGIGRAAIEAADVAVVPTRINGVDLLTLPETAEMIQKCGKPGVLFLNSVQASQKVQQGTYEFCEKIGLPVATIVHNRVSFPNAYDLGRGVVEIERPMHKARVEFSEVWHAVRNAVAVEA